MNQHDNLQFTVQWFTANLEVSKTPLGKGHDSIVILAKHKHTKQQYALKHVAQTTTENAINLFNEIQILRLIKHQNIVQMIGYCEDYSVMLIEYQPYGSLFKIMKQGPLPLVIANGITFQIADALYYLHASEITHGDIKLDNILISSEYRVKLCDFGFSKKNGQSPIPKATIQGSEGYTAPEIWTIPQDFKKCDTFSLGVVYFIMVTGHPPFDSNHPQQEDAWWKLIKTNNWEKFWKELKLTFLPNYVKELIENLLCTDYKQRFSAQQLLQILLDKSGTIEQISEEIFKRLSQQK